MAVTWCRASANLRILSGCQKTQAYNLVSCHHVKGNRIFQQDSRGVTQYVQQTTKSVKKVKFLKELFAKRMEVGPEEELHPSKYGCWNAEAERFAFAQRIGEDFEERWLRLVFRSSSFRDTELDEHEELGVSIETIVGDNTELAKLGRECAEKYIQAYLRYSYPKLFEEGIRSVCDYLLSDDTLLFLSTNFGLRDLIESSSYPPLESEYITTFLAVIGAIVKSKGEESAKYFVLDFIVPQLIGKDLTDLWKVQNPMGIVAGLLERTGRGPPEARLLYTSAKNTIMSLYSVGIYSDQKLIGKSPGETQVIAEEMAAIDALRNLVGFDESRAPLVLGDRVRSVQLDLDKVNTSVTEVLKLEDKNTKAFLES